MSANYTPAWHYWRKHQWDYLSAERDGLADQRCNHIPVRTAEQRSLHSSDTVPDQRYNHIPVRTPYTLLRYCPRSEMQSYPGPESRAAIPTHLRYCPRSEMQSYPGPDPLYTLKCLISGKQCQMARPLIYHKTKCEVSWRDMP